MGEDIAGKIREAEKEARIRAALDREKGISVAEATRLPRDRADAPLRPSAAGERLAQGQNDAGEACWFLEGRELREADVIEVYTNAANGWLRGRFVAVRDGAHLVINVWDANGQRDADGTPPFVGEFDALIPTRATCRFPVDR